MEVVQKSMGLDGFVWWIGVVENRKDPLKIGRCQVRIYNWHTDDLNLIPSADLPWAQPILPVNGTNPVTLKEGDTVMGFYLDSQDAQFPIIMGVLPGIPVKKNPNTKGFTDQRTPSQLANSPRPPQNVVYNDDGQGVTVTESSAAISYPNIINESTFSRLATGTNTSNTFVQTRLNNIVKDIPTFDPETTWSEPETKYGAMYPYDKAIETESGHIFELDDTPGKERIQLAHRTGSFVEYYPDGSRVVKVVKSDYEIVMADKNVYIMGACNVTINGKAQVYVKGDCDLKVDGDHNVNVKGNMNTKVEGNRTTNITGQDTTVVGKNYSVKAVRIDLN